MKLCEKDEQVTRFSCREGRPVVLIAELKGPTEHAEHFVEIWANRASPELTTDDGA